MPGETVWVSGGQLLSPISWKQHDLSGGKNIWAADLSAFDLAKVPGPSSFSLLSHTSPILSPFFLGFCAFSRACRDGSNEPQAGKNGRAQWQEDQDAAQPEGSSGSGGADLGADLLALVGCELQLEALLVVAESENHVPVLARRLTITTAPRWGQSHSSTERMNAREPSGPEPKGSAQSRHSGTAAQRITT